MKRYENWPSLLAACVQRHRHRPFKWGRFDCATFAALAIKAMTGENALQDFKWKSKEEAIALLRKHGGLVAMIDQRLERVDVPYAQRGDIVLVEHEGGEGNMRSRWMAVCTGGDAWGPGATGLVAAPMSAAVIAWRV